MPITTRLTGNFSHVETAQYIDHGGRFNPMPKSIPEAVREICLSFPEAEEKPSHGSPDFRVRGKAFASFVINHHGDGRVALWLPARPGVQRHFTADEPAYYFVPPYVGPRGWLGVHLNKGLHWDDVAKRVREAYELVAPTSLSAALGNTIRIKPPAKDVDPEVFDPLNTPRTKKVLIQIRQRCLAFPETSEGLQFGTPMWRAGKKTFCTVHRYRRRLCIQCWVGTERQVAMTFESRYRVPAYTGANGWIELDLEDEVNLAEVQELLNISYQHFALQRMLKAWRSG